MLIIDVFHPASYTIDHSLSGVQSHADLEIAHVLRNPENAQHNLEIAQIPRLRGTYTLYFPTHQNELQVCFLCVVFGQLEPICLQKCLG